MTAGPRDLPEDDDDLLPFDEDSTELPELFPDSYFYRGPDHPDYENEEAGL